MVLKPVAFADGLLTAVQTGAGPDMLIVHSLLADRTAFDPVLPWLAARFRVTLVNLPGFSGSACLPAGIEGYGGGRVINPDKWFHWRLLGVASAAYYVDAPLYAYRWHATNQTAQQKSSGALKYLVDEYVSSFEIDAALLERAGLSRDEVEQAFVEHGIARHGLATLARGEVERARRILLFGVSTYPRHATRNWKLWALAALSVLPLGRRVAKVAYGRRLKPQ